MIKRFNKQRSSNFFYRINERINAPTLRVLDSEGKQIGVLGKFEALKKARELRLDLVEVAPTAKPPVAKIIDFKKFLYQQAKKKKEERKKTKVSGTKEVRLGPFMGDHDLEVMITRAREFLENGNKVKLVVKFVGRQITHPEFGQAIINKTITVLSEISKVEREPHFEGKQLIVIISPDKKKDGHQEGEEKKIDEKNQEISK